MTKTTNHRSSRGNEALTSPSDVGTAASVGVAPIRHPQSEMENCTFSAPNCTFLRRFFWSTLVYQPLARKTAPSKQTSQPSPPRTGRGIKGEVSLLFSIPPSENCTFSAPNCTFFSRFVWSTLVYQPLARKTAPSQQFDSSVIATWQTPPPTPALWVPGSMKRIAIASNRRNRNRKQARTLILKTEYQ